MIAISPRLRAAQDGAPAQAALEGATVRLNLLLAEFRLFGGFGGADGMRRWGEIQHAVREVDRLRESAGA